MGLIRAMGGAVGGTLADQWKEYFYCEAMDADVLVCKGQKRVSGRSSNTKGSDNIITNGSVVAVNEGQCMIIVEQGKVVELCSEPGEFVYDTSTEPSIFEGKLSKSIKEVFATIGKRLHLAVIRQKTSGYIILILKKLSEINTEHLIRCLSGL